MPFVKVPGVDREVWCELHEASEADVPLFVSVAEYAQMSPEQFATEMAKPKMANPSFEWKLCAAHEAAFIGSQAEVRAMDASARIFEPHLRGAIATARGVGSGGRGRGGRPRSTIFSVAEDIAVIAFFFMRTGMKRQKAIDSAADYWINGNKRRFEPAKRLIDASLARIQRGGITNLSQVFEFVRHKYSLPELPKVKRKDLRGKAVATN